MQVIIEPGFLNGEIEVPASKSMMQRACAAALLHNGITTITNAGISEDDKAALNIIQQLGAKIIERSNDKIIIQSSGIINNESAINCGESGLAARLFTPIAALSENEISVEGKGSLLQRPMNEFFEILPQLNVSLKNFNGYLPFKIKGPLQPKSIKINGDFSSQFLTGILFSFTAAEKPVTIEVKNLKSKPYVDLTLQVLERFGKKIENENYTRFHINPEIFFYKKEITVNIEADWSSAAYWLVGAAINGNLSINHLNKNSLQADKKILEVLKDANCKIDFSDDKFFVSKSTLKAFETDVTDCPDLFPVLAVLASCCNGTSKIKGLHRLKHKESDREKSIVEMLQQFGVSFKAENDTLIIEGRKSLKAATINGYNDHRIVMAAAIGALNTSGKTIINNAEAVAKSYPDFFGALKKLCEK